MRSHIRYSERVQAISLTVVMVLSGSGAQTFYTAKPRCPGLMRNYIINVMTLELAKIYIMSRGAVD